MRSWIRFLFYTQANSDSQQKPLLKPATTISSHSICSLNKDKIPNVLLS